jgi:hypothetical protein
MSKLADLNVQRDELDKQIADLLREDQCTNGGTYVISDTAMTLRKVSCGDHLKPILDGMIEAHSIVLVMPTAHPRCEYQPAVYEEK